MATMFRSIQTNNRGVNMNLQGDYDAPHNSGEYGSSLQYQQSQSSAESTMSRYSNAQPQDQRTNYGAGISDSKVETRLCQSTGL